MALKKKVESIFEQIRKIDENGQEYWNARDFAKALDYSDYRNFLSVVNKAKESCKNSSQVLVEHFVEVNEMVLLGSGAERQIDSIKLSRYACYLNWKSQKIG
jgi:DNA-damage-inducible protein D